MALSLNKVTLIGNVGRDPEIRTTSDGKEIITLSLATSDSWKDKITGERKEKTEWHRVVVFSEGLVGVIKAHVKKGSRLFIEGSLQTRKWQDASGIEKYSTEIVLQNYASNLILLDSRGSSDSHSSDTGSFSNHSFGHNELDDEVPF